MWLNRMIWGIVLGIISSTWVSGQVLIVEKLAPSINSTRYDEIAPLVSWGEKTLFFTRVGSPDFSRELVVENRDLSLESGLDYQGLLGMVYSEIAGYPIAFPVESEFNQDIWSAEFTSRGFKKAVHPGAPLNNALPNSITSLTSNFGEYIIINQFAPDGGMRKGFSVIRQNAEGGWDAPNPIFIEGYDNESEGVNLHMSVDGEVILVSVEKEAGQGSNDLYVAFQTGKYRYGKLVNIGKDINTPYREITPFLSMDKKILFFSSNRYGDNDIFWSQRLDDTWSKWSKPKRLKSPINTSSDESHPFYHPSSGYLYFTSRRDGTSDIFRVKIQAQEEKLVVLRGKVRNTGSQALESGMVYIGQQGEGSFNVAFNTEDGNFSYPVKKGSNLKLICQKPGFIGHLVEIPLDERFEGAIMEVELLLDPMVEGARITHDPIFFERSKAVIRSISEPALDGLFRTLQSFPEMEVTIEGHTDNQGDPKALVQLSLERAIAVKTYLMQRGVEPDRIKVKGFGGSKPITDNSSEWMRSQNRRVEVIISGTDKKAVFR